MSDDGAFYSKVAGDIFPNDDGSPRQQIIRDFCKPGTMLTLRREPKNPFDENAVAVVLHIVRLRQIRETVTLVDAVAHVVLVNSHDGTSSYVMHAGLFRPVCCNRLLMRLADIGFFRFAHRNIAVGEVVRAALEMAGRFATMQIICQAMAAKDLSISERQTFATRALQLRYQEPIKPRRGSKPARGLKSNGTNRSAQWLKIM